MWQIVEDGLDSRRLLEGMCSYGCEYTAACIDDLYACNLDDGAYPWTCTQVFDSYTDHIDDDCSQPLEEPAG